jgi:hypothetical protein
VGDGVHIRAHVPGHRGIEILKGNITGFFRRWETDYAYVRTPYGIFEKMLPDLTHADAVTRLGNLLDEMRLVSEGSDDGQGDCE